MQGNIYLAHSGRISLRVGGHKVWTGIHAKLIGRLDTYYRMLPFMAFAKSLNSYNALPG